MQILLTVAYDGTAYVGWQRQLNGIAVQQRLEEALSSLFARSITVTGASRTDAGVHAWGQRAAFHVESTAVPVHKLPYVINHRLPPDIIVQAAETVPDDFNPRFHARQKTYRYQIYNAPFPDPQLRRYSAFVPRPLDVATMQKAAPLFTGRHDFKAFCASGSVVKTTTRHIFECRMEQQSAVSLQMIITGEGFLYNMVRIIAGTVLYTGIGKIAVQDIPDIIASGDRTRAGITMPPEGLTLLEVCYG